MPLFKGVDGERLLRAAGCMETLAFRAGEVIYPEGDYGDGMYIILSGRVNLTRYDRASRASFTIGQLEEGDFFGADVFDGDALRTSGASAVGELLVLFLPTGRAEEFSDIVPEAPARINLMLDSARLADAHPFSWLAEDETVFYMSRQHSVLLWLRLSPIVLAGAALTGIAGGALPLEANPWLGFVPGLILLLLLFSIVWVVVNWANDYYIITRSRAVVMDRVKMLYDSRLESPVDQIQSVETRTTQLGRILNYGDVLIRTWTGLLVFRAVPSPRDAALIVEDLVKRSKSTRKESELRVIDEMIRSRLAGQPARVKADPPKAETRYSPPQSLLSRLFQLRTEIGETVQFRTHWFVLWKRQLIPGLLALVSVGLAVWVLVMVSAGTLQPSLSTRLLFGACLAFLAMLSWWLYRFLDWFNDVYLITPDQVVDVNHKPLGKEDKRSAPIQNILSIEYKRLGLIGLLLNYGTVYIRVGDAVMNFDEVSNPSEVQRELFFRLEQRKAREKQAQEDLERERMADWIAAYHRISGRSPSDLRGDGESVRMIG